LIVDVRPKVELEICGREKRSALENLFQLYVHDFSDFMAPEKQVDVQDDGRFPHYPPLDAYWRDADHEVAFIRAGGALAGFVLINGHAHSGEPCDFSMAEFFVVRKYRRHGVGHAAALAAITARPGQWDIAVSRRNLGAQAFWRRVAAEIAGDAVEALDRNDDLWNGLILRFRVPAAA
jgi:predicted acetyltransferase